MAKEEPEGVEVGNETMNLNPERVEVTAAPAKKENAYTRVQEKGDARLVAAAQKIRNFGKATAGYFKKMWGSVKGVSVDTLRVLMAPDVVVAEGYKGAKSGVEAGKRALANDAKRTKELWGARYSSVENAVGSAKDAVSAAAREKINSGKEKLLAIAARAEAAYGAFEARRAMAEKVKQENMRLLARRALSAEKFALRAAMEEAQARFRAEQNALQAAMERVDSKLAAA